ncbi:MAG: LytTR family DNA-binding domain-containing protein [Bacteroidales bacterium]
MIQAIIIDDEKHSRVSLRSLLHEYCPQINISAEADGYKAGVESIRKNNPDLVFLDIQMPDGSGFRVLEEVKNDDFEVIFTTAYDSFAIKAFKYSAQDYLLKPIDPVELQNAVDKVKKLRSKNTKAGIDVLLESIHKKDKPDKIVLSTYEGLHVVEISNIIRCRSDDYYTRFFFKDRKELLVSRTLKDFESILSEHNFIRPHKSHLINVSFIKRFLKTDGGTIELSEGTEIPVSRRKKDMVLKVLSDL